MINEARTLLLNIASLPFTKPGEEFIPPDFNVLPLSPSLQIVYNILFGPNPDRSMFNYRARDFLDVIHSTELEEFITDLDPRITYLPANDSIFDKLAQRISFVQIVGTDKNLSFIGDLNELQDNRLLREWTVEVIDGSTVDVIGLDDTKGVIDTVSNAYVITGGISDLIPLISSNIQFRFDAGIGSKWTVESFAAPASSLVDISDKLEALEEGVILDLFGLEGEPFLTFRNLWFGHPFFSYRLSGLILAYIYRVGQIERT